MLSNSCILQSAVYDENDLKTLEKWVIEKYKEDLESQCSYDKLWPWGPGKMLSTNIVKRYPVRRFAIFF